MLPMGTTQETGSFNLNDPILFSAQAVEELTANASNYSENKKDLSEVPIIHFGYCSYNYCYKNANQTIVTQVRTSNLWHIVMSHIIGANVKSLVCNFYLWRADNRNV